MKLKQILILSCFSLFTFHFSPISAQQGTWFWETNGIGVGFGCSVASDIHGNCYLQGSFPNDTIHFGAYTLVNSTVTNPPFSNYVDNFLVKLDPKGNILWAKQDFIFDTSQSQGIHSDGNVCTDMAGNAYMACDFPDTLIVGTYTIVEPLGDNSYVIKYDPNGSVKWVEHSICKNNNGSGANEYASCDAKGNVYLSGAFCDTVNFGACRIIGTSPLYYANSFLVKYDSNGNVKWAKQSVYTGDNSSDVSEANTNDRFGNSFMTGSFGDTVSFGPYQLKGGNNPDFYLVKYDSNGNVKWAKQSTEIMGGSAGGGSLVTDQTGNIYVTIGFVGGIVLAPDTLIAPPGGSFFLAKYDPNGNVLWLKQASVLDANSWDINSLSIDNAKHLYLSADGGYNTCKIAFGGDTLSMNDTAKYDGASVVFKLDSNGKALCGTITPVGSLGGSSPTGIASDTSGNYVYFAATAGTVGVFGKDTIDPFAYPANAIYQGNAFPFAARWQECDSNVLYASIQTLKPLSGEVKVYPNPNNGTFTLALQNVNEPAQVEIYNILGESICKKALNSTNTVINLTEQPAGVYFYRAITNKGSLIGEGKVVKE